MKYEIGTEVIIGHSSWLEDKPCKIVSETKTCWVLDNGRKFVKEPKHNNLLYEYGHKDDLYGDYLIPYDDFAKNRLKEQILIYIINSLKNKHYNVENLDLETLQNFKNQIRK